MLQAEQGKQTREMDAQVKGLPRFQSFHSGPPTSAIQTPTIDRLLWPFQSQSQKQRGENNDKIFKKGRGGRKMKPPGLTVRPHPAALPPPTSARFTARHPLLVAQFILSLTNPSQKRQKQTNQFLSVRSPALSSDSYILAPLFISSTGAPESQSIFLPFSLFQHVTPLCSTQSCSNSLFAPISSSHRVPILARLKRFTIPLDPKKLCGMAKHLKFSKSTDSRRQLHVRH